MAVTKILVDHKIISQNTASYNDLYSLPSINGITLQGDVTTDELNIYNKQQVDALIASIRAFRVVAVPPSSPLPNVQYYIGPDDKGAYKICIYDKDLNRIDLGGSDEAKFEMYQEKQPTTKKDDGTTLYYLGHNEGEDDGKVLVSHTVESSINEIDAELQKRQNAVDNELETDSNTVVGAINEINNRIKTVNDSIVRSYASQKTSIPDARVFTHLGRYTSYNTAQNYIHTTFMFAPYFEGASHELEYLEPAILEFAASKELVMEGFQKQLYAIANNGNRTCLRYNARWADPEFWLVENWKMINEATNTKLGTIDLYYSDYYPHGSGGNLPFKITVMQEDANNGSAERPSSWVWTVNGERTTEAPTGSIMKYNWKTIGYNNMLYS